MHPARGKVMDLCLDISVSYLRVVPTRVIDILTVFAVVWPVVVVAAPAVMAATAPALAPVP